jgi:RNA polymerase sigma factor (sigma-70 family)
MKIGQVPSDSERTLAIACQAGDVAAFSELYALHASIVMRYAWSRLGDRAQAEDVMQDTFTTAWLRVRTATVVDSSLLPWLLAICANHLRNQLRRNAKHHAAALQPALEGSKSGDDLTAIREALASLSDLDRRVCELCLIDGFSYDEAARQVGSTTAAVRNRLHRARIQLRNSLADD